MSGVEASLRSILSDLRAIGASFAIVGGLAIAVRCEPRLTRDADLVVAVTDDAEAEELIRTLQKAGYQADAFTEHESRGRLATVRLTQSAHPEILVDLLFASSGIEEEVVREAEEIEILPGLEAPVARVGHLIALKLLARDDRNRPTDADDLRSLAAIANESEWSVASQAVVSITERGYSRGRDLHRALGSLRDEPGNRKAKPKL